MKIGVLGFGRAGRAVAATLLEDKSVTLQWVIRCSKKLEHRSVSEFLGIEHDEPGLLYSKDEYTAEELLDKLPVDVIVDFSSEKRINYYGETAAQRGITIISAVSDLTIS